VHENEQEKGRKYNVVEDGCLISFASNNVSNLTNDSGYPVERTILSKASLVATYDKVV
jgi:hypothetical protein